MIYKWVNDLNVFNRMKAIIKTYPRLFMLFCLLISTKILTQIGLNLEIVCIILVTIWLIYLISFFCIEFDELKYDNPYKN